MIFRTTDLCDANEGIIGHGVQIAAPVFKNFGGRNVFSGQIETLKLFEDNLLLRNVVSESGKGKVLVVDVGGLMRFGVIGEMIGKVWWSMAVLEILLHSKVWILVCVH